MDWDDLRFFLATAEAGSVSGAAQLLHVNHSTVSRRIAALEASLATRLFERHPDGVVLTEAGHRILPTCRALEDGTHDVIRLIRAGDQRLSGTVRITTSPVLADGFLTDRMPAFVERYPDIVLQLLIDIRPADLMRREADIALRIQPVGTRHKGAAILARKLGDFAWALFGAPSLLERERIREGSDLAGRPVISLPDQLEVRPGHEYVESLGLRPVAQASALLTVARLASAGVGLAFLPCILGAQQGLVCVREPRNRSELWLMVHPELRENAAVRATTDYFAELDDETRATMAGLT